MHATGVLWDLPSAKMCLLFTEHPYVSSSSAGDSYQALATAQSTQSAIQLQALISKLLAVSKTFLGATEV